MDGKIFKKVALALSAAFLVTTGAAPANAEIKKLQENLDTRNVQDAAKAPAAASSSGASSAAAGGQTAFNAEEMSIENLQKITKILSEIGKYDPKIYDTPETGNKIARYFRKLTGKMSIEDYLAEGYTEFQKGNYDAALNNFKKMLEKDPGNNKASYYIALCKMGSGNVTEATRAAEYLRDKMKDGAWEKIFKKNTDPWVEAEVAFKIGGFDSLDTYKKKIAAGNRKELHGDEYYEKYVDKKTWQFKSKEAEKEFQSIAGIDCGGFVQQVYMDLCKQNGIKAPFNSKLPSSQLTSSKYCKKMKDDGIIPPMSAKPGDFMILSDRDGWGHAFYFAGRDKDGRPLIAEASGEGKVLARPMPDRYYARYDGTYRFNEMDKIREKMVLTAGSTRAD